MGIGTSGRLVFAAFLAVVTSFVLSQFVQQYVSRHVDDASDAIVGNASPSISHLATLRAETRQAEYLLDNWVDAAVAQKPISPAQLNAALARIASEEKAYAALPRFSGEDPIWFQVQDATLDFERAVQRAMSEVEAGAPERAQNTVATLVKESGDALTDLSYRGIEFNAARGSELALEIKKDRHGALALGWLLDATCAVFAILAATVLWRVLQRNERLAADYAHLLERRAAELESFSGRVAHDILSPLGAVRLSIELAARLGDARTVELLGRGRRALLRVESLTDGLLGFAKAGAQPLPGARTEVRPVVEGLIEETREQAADARAEVVVEPLPEAAVACTTGILTSLMSNLVRNALKYMGDSSRRVVTIRVRRREARWRFEVEDTGPGLPAETLGRLFEPYVRGPSLGVPGLGLGLATVKRLAESHGGAVGVASTPGHGSLFWFELPAADLPPAEDAAPAAMH